MSRLRWWLVLVPALLVAGYAMAVLIRPEIGPPFIRDGLVTMPWAIIGHLGGGAVALLAGALQVNHSLRDRLPAVHRWLGRVYTAAVAVGGCAGLLMATRSQGGPGTHLGFGLLAVGWLLTTALAYRTIRRGDREAHRRWASRSYALTFAAVTLRLYLPAALIAGIPFMTAYPVISWLCWVPNLIVVEAWLRRHPRAEPTRLPVAV